LITFAARRAHYDLSDQAGGTPKNASPRRRDTPSQICYEFPHALHNSLTLHEALRKPN